MVKLFCYPKDPESRAIIDELHKHREEIVFEIKAHEIRHSKPCIFDTGKPDVKWYGKQECLAFIAGLVKGEKDGRSK